MAISQTRYDNITSGVGGVSQIAVRQLIGRIFTSNPLVPTGGRVDFTSADAVGAYFGTTTEEYFRALLYFGFISKNIARPQTISYAGWTPAAVAPRIYGVPGNYMLSSFTAVSNGSLTLSMGGTTQTLTGINLSAAGSLAAVATAIQTAIRGVTAGGTLWTSASVVYDAVRGSFSLVGGTTGAATISIGTPGSGINLAPLVGFTPAAIYSNGLGAQTLTQTLVTSSTASDNFGSFLFMGTLTTADILEVSQWNNAQNVKYQFMVPVTQSNAATVSAAIITLAGTAMTVNETAGEFAEMLPMIVLAATDYTKRNAVQNYMYQQLPLTPSVTTDAQANAMDLLRVNYYGQTQTAGQFLAFYQRGFLTGGATNPIDQNTFANEQWLKSAAAAAVLNLLLVQSRVPANTAGRAQLMAVLQNVVEQAAFNGTISVGKTLDVTQKLYISQITGNDLAWMQVQNAGFYLNTTFDKSVIVESTTTRTEYKGVYTLLYSKDDVIRKVEGTHVLV